MRRLILLAATALLISGVGCRRDRPQVETIEEGSATLASMVHVADPATATQLIRGFYDVEQNSWRWTMGRFSVALRPPSGGEQKGATLILRFSIPDAVIARLKSVTLSATVNETPLAPETYSKAGDYTYSRDVPAAALNAPTVTVDFELDKKLEPGVVEQRELGLVVTTVGFEAK